MLTDMMNPRIIIIIYLVLFGSGNSETCTSFQISKDNLNKALIGHSILEISDITHHECAKTCMSFTTCKSIDYDNNERACKLNDVEKSSADQSEFETKKGSIFSDINEWPSAMVKSCGSRPCKANQRCQISGDSHKCIDISPCGMPSVWNANVVLYQPNEAWGTYSAIVRCKAGYQTWKKEIKCLESGNWENTLCADCYSTTKPRENGTEFSLKDSSFDGCHE